MANAEWQKTYRNSGWIAALQSVQCLVMKRGAGVLRGKEEPTGPGETPDCGGRGGQTHRRCGRTQDSSSVSWDEVREWHGHIYTTKRKIDS